MTVFYPQQTPPSLVFAYADGMFAIETEAPSTSNIQLHLEKQRPRVAVAYSLQTGEDLC